jgi:hypothetical protein
MTTHALNDVFRGLRTVGLTKGQVTAILPEWWEPDIARSPSGLMETALLLGRRLCLDAGALAEGRIEKSAGLSAPRFKHTVRVTAEQLEPATLMASSLARAVLGAFPERGPIVGRTATSVREELLAQPEGRVDFDALLSLCWSMGIPVIPIPNLPKGVRKMDAVAIKIGKRPVIVIALRNNSKAWLSFLLAHELGHICLGHVPENAAIVEGSLRDSTDFDAESQLDTQETEANSFAHMVLGGKNVDRAIDSWPDAFAPVNLAIRAMEDAKALHTAPGHLILRHGFKTKRWPEARSALNFLADDMDAQTALLDHMREEIDTAAISDDMQDFVEQITGIVARI